jgi:NAD(P)-dependent dehydrogenase (short-subunit alcohol dehydrogenase family)
MKSIVIVGGSKGIGKSILESQLALGNNVFNLSRTSPKIQHKNLTHFNVDILTDDLPAIETIDTLIYCPGSINLKPITTLKIEDFESDFQINVLGAVRFIKQYLSTLKKSENASVLLFSTVAVKLGMPFHTSIAVAKAGIEGLTRSLGAELAPKIRVNAIAPTVTNTELAAKILRNETAKEAIKERHPLKKYLSTNEVAAMANFLISENALSISGQVLELDCGIVTFKI